MYCYVHQSTVVYNIVLLNEVTGELDTKIGNEKRNEGRGDEAGPETSKSL